MILLAILAQIALWVGPFLLAPLALAVYFHFGGRA